MALSSLGDGRRCPQDDHRQVMLWRLFGRNTGCCLLLTDKEVVAGRCRATARASRRHSGAVRGKTMTATVAGKPATKKGKDGKKYQEVKVSKVKIES